MMLIYWLSFILLVTFAATQTENSEKMESCSMVCNCNTGEATSHSLETPKMQGPPGKQGIKGEIGIPGMKGEKGDTGSKGQKGDEVEKTPLSPILIAMSASSCQELKVVHGVEASGYYPMRVGKTSRIELKYCDFNSYPDSATCVELFQRHNKTTEGYYLYGANVGRGEFKFCGDILTCERLQQVKPEIVSGSGYYSLSNMQSNLIRVYCNFLQTPAVTEIHHDRMTDETRIPSSCETAGCFSAAPLYSIRGPELEKIINNSLSCRQFIKLKCRGVQIFRSSYTWWVSRDGQKMTYWGGSRRAGYCACGESNSCIDNQWKCNCDQNSETITPSDEGYLTDKTKLPIKELRVGDMGGTNEEGWYTIGKLECSGQV